MPHGVFEWVLAILLFIPGVVLLALHLFVGLGMLIMAVQKTNDWFWWKVTYLVHKRTAEAQKRLDALMGRSKKPPFTMPQMRYARGGKE